MISVVLLQTLASRMADRFPFEVTPVLGTGHVPGPLLCAQGVEVNKILYGMMDLLTCT